jgi:hypothetical protein
MISIKAVIAGRWMLVRCVFFIIASSPSAEKFWANSDASASTKMIQDSQSVFPGRARQTHMSLCLERLETKEMRFDSINSPRRRAETAVFSGRTFIAFADHFGGGRSNDLGIAGASDNGTAGIRECERRHKLSCL